MAETLFANPLGAIGQAVNTAGAMDQLNRMRAQDQTMQQDRGIALQDRQRQLQRESIEFAAKAGSALDSVQDPAQKSAMYKQLRNMAGLQGYDLSKFPPDYNPQAQQMLDLAKATIAQAGQGMFAPMPAFDAQGNPVFVQGSRAGGLKQIEGGYRPFTATVDEKADAAIRQAQAASDIKVGAAPLIAAGSERGKLGVQAQLAPGIEAAKTAAKEGAKAAVEREGAARSNATALDVYETGMNSLMSALGDTSTGPIAGRLPALTANQQIAEGAQAAMAPVLKQMFRSSGEGTFTDKDQEMLIKMLPTRKDHPEAAKAKIQGIDAIVRAKLNQSSAAAPQQPAVGGYQQGQIIEANGKRYRVTGGDPNDPDVEEVQSGSGEYEYDPATGKLVPR